MTQRKKKDYTENIKGNGDHSHMIKKKEELPMSVMDGCESQHRTSVIEERVCPECGKEVEVFTSRGKITEDTACDCGYVFKAEEAVPLKTEPKEK